MRHTKGLRPTLRAGALLVALTACFAAVGCGTAGDRRAGGLRAGALHVVVVRHAEKVDDGTRDPPLSAQGQARARALVRQLAGTPLAAVYATPLQRTRLTAEPAAGAHGVPVRTYPADIAATQFAAQLRRDHAAGVVLVVGHANTVPALVSALCACPVAAIDEGAYGGRYDIGVDADGSASLTEGRY